jgi:hypothetical protein
VVVDWDGGNDAGIVHTDGNSCTVDLSGDGIEDEHWVGIEVAPGFKEDEPPYDGSGKELVISTDNGIGTISNTNEYGASTISLDDLSVDSNSWFTVSLDGNAFRFATAGGDSSAVVGIGVVATDSVAVPDRIRFNPDGAQLTWLVVGGLATVFGVTDVFSDTGTGIASGWFLGNFADESRLIANSSLSSIFGTGWCEKGNDGAFRGWSVGNFGQDTLLLSQGSCSATVFGPSFVESSNTFQNWTIGNLANGTNLIASSMFNGAIFGPGAVVGVAPTDGTSGTCTNWTTEFQGNATASVWGFGSSGLLGLIDFADAIATAKEGGWLEELAGSVAINVEDLVKI